MSMLMKANGFKRSKAGLWLSLGSTAFGAVTVAKDIKKARSEEDTLKLVHAVVGAVALVTGTALLLRELRALSSNDVLSG